MNKLPSEIEKIFGKSFFSIDTEPDGSCFYHSVLYLTSIDYRSAKTYKENKQMVRDFRNFLCEKLTEQIWEAKYKPFVSYQKMKTRLKTFNKWAGHLEWCFVSDILKLNIFIFTERGIYHGCPGQENFDVTRNSICILNSGECHYEPIVMMMNKDEKIRTKLGPNLRLIKRILES